MNVTQKPQRAFLTVTLITVLAVTMVFMVYAALLATYTGADVTITGMGGEVQYSLTQTGTYSAGAISQGEGAEWYAEVYLANPPTQTVTVKWTLQRQEGSDWTTIQPTNVTQFTSPSISLIPSTYDVYAFQSGGNTIDNNYNWGQHTTVADTYRVLAEINTV